MHIAHLKLTNFRNYRHLDLDLPARKIVLEGDNAQGKTNLLEALFFLATTRSPRASNERELIGWGGGDEFFPGARVAARVERAGGPLQLEIVLRAERLPRLAGAAGNNGDAASDDYLASLVTGARKQVRVNGVPRRAADVVGQMKVVMFSAPDIELVAGPPALRRRYLDVSLSQIDNRYLRSLQRYQRVLQQRNHLLRRIQGGEARPEELAFWDQEIVQHGSYITLQRCDLLSSLGPLAREIHRGVTAGQEDLNVRYHPNLHQGWRDAPARAEALSDAFRKDLSKSLGREIAQGMSLVGPHRDDLQFLVKGVDMAMYGSRGQQRAIVESLKLAEAQLMAERTGEAPVLILDDVLSELDSLRQQQLLQAIDPYPQVLITTTGPELIPQDFLSQAIRYRVKSGTVSPVVGRSETLNSDP
ncbi:MAG: DNA replication/repair protein RecF [Chloroflexi bacterium]|nr:DNA replication/repair protein RecF [Chloroflexota bacterium]